MIHMIYMFIIHHKVSKSEMTTIYNNDITVNGGHKMRDRQGTPKEIIEVNQNHTGADYHQCGTSLTIIKICL